MSSYHLSRRASQDVVEICSHIAKDSPLAADRFADHLHRTFQQLAEGLMVGERFVDSQKRETRRISQGNYVIYHRRVGRVTEIVRVAHGARLLENLEE
jgi:plasmid stabilization system protein ParE